LDAVGRGVVGIDAVGPGVPGTAVAVTAAVGVAAGPDAIGRGVGGIVAVGVAAGPDAVGRGELGRCVPEAVGDGCGGSVHATSATQVGAGAAVGVAGTWGEVTVGDGAGAAPPSANALAAATVPKRPTPTAATEMIRTRFAGFRRMQCSRRDRGPRAWAFAWTDVSARLRLSIAM